jgi:aspartate/methionine/tyrosine aminotransferase
MQSFGNARLAAIEPSAIRAIHDRKRATSIDLGMGQPTLRPDIEPFQVALQWVREHGSPYAPPGGLPELREMVARIYGGHYHTSASNVAVLNGSQEGIYLAIKVLLDPHTDEVLLTDPAYLSYQRCCDLEGVSYRKVTLSARDGFAIRADAVLDAITPATRLIMLGSPGNPTASVMDEREVRRLAHALIDRKGPPVWVAVDEVYRELTFTGKPYPSLLDHYPHAIALQSLSKSCALTGLRLGFFIGPATAVEAVIRAHGLMVLNVNMFAQRVALDIMRDPSRLRAHYGWYVAQRQVLIESAYSNGLHIIEPQGSFYSMLALPEAWSSSEAAADHLLERYDVVTVPGIIFGAAGEGYLRISWVAAPASLIQGLERIAEFCTKKPV